MIVVTNNDQLGRNIRYFRCRKGITCEELALIAELDAKELHLIEEGLQREIKGDVLLKISEELNISLEDLVEKQINRQNSKRSS